MNKIILIFLSLYTFSVYSQESSKPDDFHRLLITNNENELMVVKIKGTDFWVTPGLYSQTNELIYENLYDLARVYNLTITKPDLRGVFVLKNKQTKAVLHRYFYHAIAAGGEIKTPGNIEEIKWLAIDEAMQVITFPHINILLKQITDRPETIWTGTILRYKEQGQLKAKMLDEFYPYSK